MTRLSSHVRAKLFVTVWSVQDWKVKPSPF